MNDFKKAVTLAYIDAWTEAIHNGATGEYMHGTVIDALFAMPEMQAIKRYIQTTTDMGNRPSPAWDRLPDSVKYWVVEE